jgi:hypothetical protein
MNFVDKEAIKVFVQTTLGCGCPEEVFQHISCESGITQNGIGVMHKINIGNRLLVYVLPIDTTASLREVLPKIIGIGKSERDNSGFNRFRLVLAADDKELFQKAAEDLFLKIQKDEKIHLHILPKTSIPEF